VLERLASLHPAALAGAGPARTAGIDTERFHPETARDRSRQIMTQTSSARVDIGDAGSVPSQS
jgi:hypothetical protein